MDLFSSLGFIIKKAGQAGAQFEKFLPSYLNSDGIWGSSDNTLYQQPSKFAVSQQQPPVKSSTQAVAPKTASLAGGVKSIINNAESSLLSQVPVVQQFARSQGQGISMSEASKQMGGKGSFAEGGFKINNAQPVIQARLEAIKNGTSQQDAIAKEAAKSVGNLAIGAVNLEGGAISRAAHEASLIEKLSGLTKKAEIQPVLEKAGIATEDALRVSGDIAKSKDPAVIRNILSGISDIPPVPPTPAGAATDAVQNLGSRERGFITSVKEQFPNLERVSGQYIPRSTDELSIKASNLVKTSIDDATVIALKGTDDKSVATAAELIKHYSELAAKSTDSSVSDILNQKAADIANEVARRLTEAGRTVQAASILGRLTPEGQLKFAAKEIQKYNQAIDMGKTGLFGLKSKVPELTGAAAEELLSEMRAINKMPDGVEKAMRFHNLQNKISDMVPSSLYQKVITIWKAGLLTGLRTSGLNVIANTAHAGSEVAKDYPGVVVDSVVSLFTGKRTLSANIRGNGGTLEGFKKGITTLKTGFNERNIGEKFDYKRVNFGKSKFAKALQKYEETIFNTLGAEDQPFYYGAKARSLVNQAIAQAKNEGLKGAERTAFVNKLVSQPTDEMIKYAVLDAEVATFQNQTLLGDVAKQIQRIPGGEVILPFGKTPASVATQMINYSPVGIVKAIVENTGRGKFDQRLFSQQMGRALTGTAGYAAGFYLGSKGLISLATPTDEKEKQRWYAEGKVQNSIKVGGKWRSLNTLGPVGQALQIGAQVQDSFQNSGSITEAMSKAGWGSLKSFSQQTFLTGLNQSVAALNDPERSAGSYVNSLISSLIPTGVGDLAKVGDSKERVNSSLAGAVEAKIPGLRNTLQPKVDVLGNERKLPGNKIENLVDPTRPSNVISGPVLNELDRLGTGLTIPGGKNGYDSLTPEENTRLALLAGRIKAAKLQELINRPQYKTAGREDQIKAIDDFNSKSNDTARAAAVLESTHGLGGEELMKELQKHIDSGLMSKSIYALYLTMR